MVVNKTRIKVHSVCSLLCIQQSLNKVIYRLISMFSIIVKIQTVLRICIRTCVIKCHQHQYRGT
jgi:hypothetical protein